MVAPRAYLFQGGCPLLQAAAQFLQLLQVRLQMFTCLLPSVIDSLELA